MALNKVHLEGKPPRPRSLPSLLAILAVTFVLVAVPLSKVMLNPQGSGWQPQVAPHIRGHQPQRQAAAWLPEGQAALPADNGEAEALQGTAEQEQEAAKLGSQKQHLQQQQEEDEEVEVEGTTGQQGKPSGTLEGSLEGGEGIQEELEGGERRPRQAVLPIDVQQHAQRGPCQRLLWFVAMGGRVAPDRLQYYRAALLSARAHAPSLAPVLIYSGETNDFVAWAKANGAHVVNHTLSFLSKFETVVRAADKHQAKKNLDAQGVWLRLDVPLVVSQLQKEGLPQLLANTSTAYALYTDVDVMFMPGHDHSTCTVPLPRLFSIGPEAKKGTTSNTGVMVMHVEAFAREVPSMLAFAERHLFKFLAMDQGMVLNYMKERNRKIELLPDRYNWKGYWGSDPEAAILHWHGPKPERCLPCWLPRRSQPDWAQQCEALYQQLRVGLRRNVTDSPEMMRVKCGPKYMALLEKCPDGGDLYAKMLEQFEAYQRQGPAFGEQRQQQQAGQLLQPAAAVAQQLREQQQRQQQLGGALPQQRGASMPPAAAGAAAAAQVASRSSAASQAAAAGATGQGTAEHNQLVPGTQEHAAVELQ